MGVCATVSGMKILVTGSSGTIGTRLCEKLLEAGHEVIGADWEPCKWNEQVENLRIDIDLRHKEEFSKLPTDVELIIHLAANARVYELVENPDRAMDNFIDTFNILEHARKNGIKKMMFASSRETYGNIHLPEGEAYSEDKAHFMTCESPYTASKIGGEALFEAYKRCYNIDTIIFRFSNVYGMYDDTIRVVPLFYRQAKAGETLKVFGKDKCLDFTYIDDIVEGVIRVLDRPAQSNADWSGDDPDTGTSHAPWRVYNIGNNSPIDLLVYIRAIEEVLGIEAEKELLPLQPGDVPDTYANVDDLVSDIGYKPSMPVQDGVKNFVNWYRDYNSI